jgi:hypothetical protein
MTIKEIVERWAKEALIDSIDKSKLTTEEVEIYECCAVVYNKLQNDILNAYNNILKTFYVEHGRNITLEEFKDHVKLFNNPEIFIDIFNGLYYEVQQQIADYIVSNYKALLFLEEEEV